MGAFDALARVAHRAVPVPGSEYQAGWQRGRWRDRLVALEPALGGLVADGSEGADVLEVLRLLRNTVHGAGLQALGLSRGGGRRHGTAVSLPSSEIETLVEVLRRRGWDEEWGLTEFGGGRFHATPDLVIEHVLGAALPLMNAMMTATPVERFPPLQEGEIKHGPPTGDDPSDAFATRHQRSLRWQLGFT